MEIPKKIKVNGIDYEIELVEEFKDELHEGAEYRGKVLFKENKIMLLNSYQTDDKFRTLLHEALHILEDDYKMELSEDTIRRIVSGLYQVLKDNNLLKE